MLNKKESVIPQIEKNVITYQPLTKDTIKAIFDLIFKYTEDDIYDPYRNMDYRTKEKFEELMKEYFKDSPKPLKIKE